MKWLLLIVGLLLLALQWRLWLGENSVGELHQLKQKIADQQQQNDTLREANRQLLLRINNLRNGDKVLEETARRELGMIKKGETFLLYIPEEEQP